MKFSWGSFVISGNGLKLTLSFRNNRIVSIGIRKIPAGKKCREDIPPFWRPAASALKKYLNGGKTIPRLPLDRSLLTGFQKKVFAELGRVPRGKVITYEELAVRVKNKNYRRAVAQALKANPFPLAIACHRVVAKEGLGGYSGGIAIKKKLLELEGAVYKKKQCSIFKTFKKIEPGHLILTPIKQDFHCQGRKS